MVTLQLWQKEVARRLHANPSKKGFPWGMNAISNELCAKPLKRGLNRGCIQPIGLHVNPSKWGLHGGYAQPHGVICKSRWKGACMGVTVNPEGLWANISEMGMRANPSVSCLYWGYMQTYMKPLFQKTFFAKNCMECSDLHSKVILPITNPMWMGMLLGWGCKIEKKNSC